MEPAVPGGTLWLGENLHFSTGKRSEAGKRTHHRRTSPEFQNDDLRVYEGCLAVAVAHISIYLHRGRSKMATDICIWVGKRIRALRLKRGWTQQILADHAGIERSHLARLEAGKREAGLLMLEKISEALEVAAADLLR